MALSHEMNRIICAALRVLTRHVGRANPVRQMRESADLQKEARQRVLENLRQRASIGTPLSINIHERLGEGARTLAAIERRREEEDNPLIGLNIEERIVGWELRNLEIATLADEAGGA